MAADFIMPRLPDQQQLHYHPAQQKPTFQPDYEHHPQSAQISPLSTSNNASHSHSPTSPKSYHERKLRPLYMPAVLRPNEHPSKAMTPKSHSHSASRSSFDDERPVTSASSFISLTGLGAFSRLSRRSTGDSGKCVGSEWGNLDMFPRVTAQPTRSHWKPDNDSTICDEPACQKYFTYFNRRHHCRRCGNLFCDEHSSYEIPLDQDAKFNPRGTVSRSCAHCYHEFEVWRSRTNSQASGSSDGTDSRNADGNAENPRTPIVANTPTTPKSAQEIAASVPRDWNWSTF